MTILTVPHVLLYLRCRACSHRYESTRRDTLCPVCLSEPVVYGIKVEELPSQDWEGPQNGERSPRRTPDPDDS